jgi:hypothetical protein
MKLATLDRRSRRDADVVTLGPDQFFETTFARLAQAHGDLAAAGMHALDAPPLSLEVEGRTWTVIASHGSIDVVPGPVDGATVLTFDREQFSDWAQQLRTLNAMSVAGELERRGGRSRDVGAWDSIWIALLEGWPVVDPELTFTDRHGGELDMTRAFGPADDPDDVAHFLLEAGFVHLHGWLDPAVMASIAEDIRRAEPTYAPDDGRSWWATLGDGTTRCVRLQHFVDHSPATEDLLRSATWQQIRQTIAGSGELVQGPVEGNCVEALIKPLGVVKGVSDIPWHRDCNFGRHAYGCASTTVGISVTPGDETRGLLRVVAGSHRLAMPAERASHAPYLPVVPVPTQPGDVTVHLSCTLHEAMPPSSDERLVLYTGFGLPPRSDDQPSGGRALSDLRELAHKVRSQDPSPLADLLAAGE